MLNTIPSPTRSLSDLAREERSFTFNHFTCEHAWVIGNILRNALRTIDLPAIIHISLSSSLTLFHSPSMPGMMPDHEKWIQRKRQTVFRWGNSTWYQSCKFGGDEKRMQDFYGLASDEATSYTLEGGGYPVFVKGVEGVVGAIVLAGLGGEQAHALLIKALEEYRELRNDFRSPMRSATVKNQ
ncbi:hypothetical protein DM02DRAFT_519470 [Periconia macrospinosa]|uniref:DUF336-domain-containing protein n=1 Tax=Periconia macrospinosa TaxID=97972 RepID=A0A2V1E0D7_9PLEO|nr:hypothetical protein DM02DRAFT_519470 [Periconia macrospinosa]